MSLNVAQYIQSRGLIEEWLHNLKKNKATPLESIERLVCLICFLQDSSSCTQQLLDSFKRADGYIFLAELLLSLEDTLHNQKADSKKQESMECEDALRNLVLLVASLATCGFIELRPSAPSSGGQSGFRLPRPMGRGVSVRNIPAFQVLQTVWTRSKSLILTTTILDVILSLYQQDPANYFILLPQKTISILADRVMEKPIDNMRRFFNIIEWVGLNLGYVLSEELEPILAILRQNVSIEFTMGSFSMIERLIKQKRTYKGIAVDVGFVAVAAQTLIAQQNRLEQENTPQSTNFDLTNITALCRQVCLTTTYMVQDAQDEGRASRSFFVSGGFEAVIKLMSNIPTRSAALELARSLMIADPELGINSILNFLHEESSRKDRTLCMDVTRCLSQILQSSPEAQIAFANGRGFELIEVFLNEFKGAFSPEKSFGRTGLPRVETTEELETVMNLIFSSISGCGKGFATFRRVLPIEKLTQLIRSFGIFYEYKTMENNTESTLQIELDILSITNFNDILNGHHNLSISMRRVLLVIVAILKVSVVEKKIKLAHFLVVILKLVPAILVPDPPQRSFLQCCILETIQKLLSHPENARHVSPELSDDLLEILCSEPYVNFISDYVSSTNETKLSRLTFQLLEGLLSTSASPKYLYLYLRLLEPLNTSGMAADSQSLRPRVFRSILEILKRRCENKLPEVPAILRLNSSSGRSAGIEIPGLLPVAAEGTLSDFPTMASSISSGLTGSIQHSWPPVNGFCISTWISIKNIPDEGPVALPMVTIWRQGITRKSSYVVLSVLITKSKHVVVSTRELPYNAHNQLEELEIDFTEPSAQSPNFENVDSVVGKLPKPFFDGELHHFHLQFTRGLIKQSLCYLWVDSGCVELSNSGKLRYPSGSTSSYHLSGASSHCVNMTLGTTDSLSQLPKADWSISSLYCFNEALPANLAANIFNKGPLYRGCFQQLQMVNEDGILLALFPENGLNQSEELILKNGVSCLTGQERAVGGFLSDVPGNDGDPVEIVPATVPYGSLLGVGGPFLFLSLVEQAEDLDSLVDALDSFSRVIQLSPAVSAEFELERTLPILAYLLSEKTPLFQSRLIFYVVIQITRTASFGGAKAPASINSEALNLLILDLFLWKSSECLRYILEHVLELMRGSKSHPSTLKEEILRSEICPNLLQLLFEHDIPDSCIGSAYDLLEALTSSDDDLLMIGNSLIYAVQIKREVFLAIAKMFFRLMTSDKKSTEFADRFEKLFGWELLLTLLDQCPPSDQPVILSLLSALFLSCPASSERFLNGSLLQKTTKSKKEKGFDLTYEAPEDQVANDEAPRTANCFKILSKLLERSVDNVQNCLIILGLLIGQAVDPDTAGTRQLGEGFIENQASSPNALTSSCFTLIYSILRRQLTNNDDSATQAVFPMLMELYRNHLPKFGKAFFQEQLVQQLVYVLYPYESPATKLSDEMQSAEKLVIDQLIALFTNSVSLGCGSIVFKNVCDAILGVNPPQGALPIQQKAVFTTLVDALQSFIRLTNLPWNWPVHLEFSQRLTTIENLSHFLARVVDRIWEFDCYKSALYDLCHTMANLLIRSRSNRAPRAVLESLEHTLWKCMYLNLCKSTMTEAEQLVAAAAVDLIIEFKAVIFPFTQEGNKDAIEYALLLAHCLFQLSGDSGGRRFIEQVSSEDRIHAPTVIHETLNNSITAAWNILLASRCLEFEAHCKVSIPPGSSIDVGKIMLRDMASRQWTSFKEKSKPKVQPPGGMLRKLSGSMGKFTSASRRALTVKRTASVSDAMSWLRLECEVLRDQIANEMSDKAFQYGRKMSAAKADWEEISLGLTMPGGLFGPSKPDKFVRWMLDTSEGPARTRRLMVPNTKFYENYPPISSCGLPGKHKKPSSSLSEEFYRAKNPNIEHRRISSQSSTASPSEVEVLKQESIEIESIAAKLGNAPKVSTSSNDDSGPPLSPIEEPPLSPTGTSQDVFGAETNPQISGKILEPGDKVRYSYRIGRVAGLDAHEGLLVIGKQKIYLIDGLGITKDNKIKEIVRMKEEESQFVIPTRTNEAPADNPIQVNKFSLNQIRNIEKRRYLLQPIGLELFLANGRTYLLAFEKNERQRALQRLLQYAPQARTADASQMMDGLTKKWENGEISNFEYLVILNTWAGRTYNDLMQYPIFPWVIADYDSSALDFAKSETFRDFSLPMGAQAADRLAQFRKRYKELCELGSETSPYYYGTHYSSAMIVSSFLVRSEPFTDFFLRLQGGHFDLPDRMFHSVKEAWLSASTRNNADVRELIPEFFYLPEFLENRNKFDLGKKQSGTELGDVVLPTWARGSTREFVRIHRAALESPYVSSNISQWIDLIFGFKQAGEAALDVHNLFHPLFYEGQVDVFSIQDPLQRNAAIGFINNFGQIPTKLFNKPHPQRKGPWNRVSIAEATLIAGLKNAFYHKLNQVRSSEKPLIERTGKVGSILINERGDLKALPFGRIRAGATKDVLWQNPDFSIRYLASDSEKPIAIFEDLYRSPITVAATLGEELLFLGHRDTSITAWHTDLKQKSVSLARVMRGHGNLITSLRCLPEYGVLISGCKDGRVSIWDVSTFKIIRLLGTHSSEIMDIKACWITGDIFVASSRQISVYSINGDPLGSVQTEKVACIGAPAGREWERPRMVLSGHTDGSIRVWARELVPCRNSSLSSTSSQEESSRASSWGMSGTCWEERLVLRSKLALPSNDSESSIGVTSFGISHDHSRFYTGDSRGRVFSWTS